MSTPTPTILLSATCAVLVVSHLFQWREIEKLREEKETLRLAASSRAAPRTHRPPDAPGASRTGSATENTPDGREEPAITADGTRTNRPRRNPALSEPEADQSTAGPELATGDASPTEGPGLSPLLFTATLPFTPPQVAGKVHWDHSQATGAPDTLNAGDLPTAWAPKSPHSGEQWLALGYQTPVEIREINIHETNSSGAITKVTAFLPDGTEKTLWTGVTKAGAPDEILETSVPVPPGITSSRIKIYVDTNRVESWPEIDAVELVGSNGQRQWAASSQASSSYSETYGPAPAR